MAFVDQGTDVGERDPGVLAARIAPTFDRFQDRLRPVAAERPIHIDDDERGTLAEAAAGAVAGGLEHRLVTFGQELGPDGLRHASSCSFRSDPVVNQPSG